MNSGRRAALQTYHAVQASDLAAAFNDALKKTRLEPGDYGVELTAPEGPSTAGGIQALQHICLLPREAGYPTIVIGYANHAEGKAELRTYDCVNAAFAQRFRTGLPIDRVRYAHVVALAKQMLEFLRLVTLVVERPDAVAPPRSPYGKKPSFVAAAALALASVGFSAAVVHWVMLLRGHGR